MANPTLIRYLRAPIPTASFKLCHWYITASGLCICYCTPFALVDQFHHANGLYFQSRLEMKLAMFVCVCVGVMGGMRRQLQTLQ